MAKLRPSGKHHACWVSNPLRESASVVGFSRTGVSLALVTYLSTEGLSGVCSSSVRIKFTVQFFFPEKTFAVGCNFHFMVA